MIAGLDGIAPDLFTTAARICVGFDGVHVCTSDGTGGRVFAIEEWPWNGEVVTKTHGICLACAEAWERKQRAAEEAA